MERTQHQIASEIARSRGELGNAAMLAVSRGAITTDSGKALNLHLGVVEPKQLLAHSKRKRKDALLEEIADEIRLRRHHLETHRIIPLAGRLVETTMLALVVGEADGVTRSRSELLEHELTSGVSQKRGINPNIVIDQTIINDLRWLSASTLPRRQL